MPKGVWINGPDGVKQNTGQPVYNPAGRNLRNVWTINPGSFKGSHFATFPPALVEPMIKAGTSARGCCSSCGAPFEKVTGQHCSQCDSIVPTQAKSCPSCGFVNDWKERREIHPQYTETDWSTPGRGTPRKNGSMGQSQTVSTGWAPTCACDAGEPVPCTVLDPFAGTFITGEVAIRLGRGAVGIELSTDYCDEHIIPRLEAPLQMELAL